MYQDMQPLVHYLKQEMAARDWNIMDVARRCDLQHPLVSRWLAGANVPSIRSCRAIATGFGVSEDEVIRMAGYLSPKRTEPAFDHAELSVARLVPELCALPADDIDEIVGATLCIIRARKRRRESDTPGT